MSKVFGKFYIRLQDGLDCQDENLAFWILLAAYSKLTVAVRLLVICTLAWRILVPQANQPVVMESLLTHEGPLPKNKSMGHGQRCLGVAIVFLTIR